MDPTAQANNPNPQGDAAKSPIEPGQFVVAGGEPASPPGQPINQPAQQPQSPPQPRPGFSLAQDKNLAQSFPTPPPQPPQPQSPPPQPQIPPQPPQPETPMQPDPTPFNGPNQPASAPAQQQPPGSKMKKIKLLVIIVAILILIGIVAALAWFFILNKPQTAQTVKTENTQELIEPTPTPQAPSTGGFGNLPQATDSVQASESGQPAEQMTLPPPPLPSP